MDIHSFVTVYSMQDVKLVMEELRNDEVRG